MFIVHILVYNILCCIKGKPAEGKKKNYTELTWGELGNRFLLVDNGYMVKAGSFFLPPPSNHRKQAEKKAKGAKKRAMKDARQASPAGEGDPQIHDSGTRLPAAA